MKRSLCDQCHYPEITCICSAVNPITCKTQFDIIQHPSEIKVAKNTARICKLCISQTNIWVGEASESFAQLQAELKNEKRRILVLYPEDDAISLDAVITQHFSTSNSIQITTQTTKQDTEETNFDTLNGVADFRILLIDGTWKKAYKIWKLNPWLGNYQKTILPNF